MRSSATQERLGVESLLLHLGRSQLKWLGHLVWMPLERLSREVLEARPTVKRPPVRPRMRRRDYIDSLALIGAPWDPPGGSY